MALVLAVEEIEATQLRHLAPVLARVLREVLQDGRYFLLLDVAGDWGYYAQFMPSEAGELHCEVVANEFLSPQHQLGEEAQGLLIGLGWSSPCPNHTMYWRAPVPVDLVAERVVRTLREAHGAPARAELHARLGRRIERPDRTAGFVVEGCWSASEGPVRAFGVDGPEQPVFKVRARSRPAVTQLLALVPDDRLEDARRGWAEGSSEPVAGVARDLSWALPLAPGIDSLPLVAIEVPIADLDELTRDRWVRFATRR
jgi:hypothetical protein